MARVQRRLRQNYQAGNAGATQASQENKMTEFHKILLLEEIMKMHTSFLILMHAMPMTTMITLIVLRTITVTLPQPPTVTIYLMYMFMKAKQVINSLNMLMVIKRKAKQEINPMKMTQTSATPILMHLMLLLRMITMRMKGLCL